MKLFDFYQQNKKAQISSFVKIEIKFELIK
jgi:hypothetical protein